jgi:hypothetical protein
MASPESTIKNNHCRAGVDGDGLAANGNRIDDGAYIANPGNLVGDHLT